MTKSILSSTGGDCAEILAKLGFEDGKRACRNLELLSKTALRDKLDPIVEKALSSPSPDAALNNLEPIIQGLPEDLIGRITDEALSRLVTIAGSSMFLSNILSRNPEYLEWLFLKDGLGQSKDADIFRAELGGRLEGVNDFEGMARELRLYKQKEYLRIGAKDLLGLCGVNEVTREISDLASASLDAAYGFSFKNLKESYGAPLYTDDSGNVREAALCVIGLGKLGGRELNFSSDIDIIYIYSSDKGDTAGIGGKESSRISLHAFFVKLSMMMTKLISSVTSEGFVFRVDLDLRPEGRSGDVANSLRSAEIYYESWGQSWERAAMIKARPVAGSMELGSAFIEMIRPFVYRRYLDFTALDEIKSMKEKIDLSLLRRNHDAVDVKLGAGGIREIEFFCQALQLIHAGRNPDVRERHTITAIGKLKDRGFLKEEEASTLKEGYMFLRNLEHRIQIVEGRQSQAIPARAAELERLARMMGFKDTAQKKAGEFFWEEYGKKTSAIHEVYRSLFYRADEDTEELPEKVLVLFSTDISEEESISRLDALGFKDPKEALRNLNLIKTGPPFLHLSAKAGVLLQKLAPVFLSRATRSPDPDRALSHLERFISSVGARTTFYSLLWENRKVIDELLKLFGTSVFLSRAIIERPESLDLLLSKELATPYKSRSAVFEEMFKEIGQQPDYEERLEAIRRLRNQEVFRIGINDVFGNLTTRQISNQLTFLAEASLDAALQVSYDELTRRYGVSEGRFAVLGLGKLGGRELIYGSDLDILFVYESPADSMTSGPKRVSAHEFFVRLGQRIISVLTLRTKEGFVFNVDARLRPSGSAGPLVVSKDALIGYHRGKTQVWERQALTRSRPAAGDLAFGRGIIKELADTILSKPLTPEDVSEMLRVRTRMEVEIAKEDAKRYNIKTGKGGLVDIEFLVQALQLKFGAGQEALRTPCTGKALSRLYKNGAVGKEDYEFLKKAYSFLRLLELRLRVVHDRPEGYLVRGSEELMTLARRAGYGPEDSGERLWAEYGNTAGRVRDIYLKTLRGLQVEPD